MCKTHSRAERGRLRQTTSSRKFASSARSAFCVIGNSIGFSYYTKNTQKYRIFPVSLCIAIHRFCFMLFLYSFTFPVQSVQMSFQIHCFKIVLAQSLIQYNCNRIGQIQGTDIANHRDTDTCFLIIDQNFFRNSGTFLAKHNITVILIRHITVSLLCSVVAIYIFAPGFFF